MDRDLVSRRNFLIGAGALAAASALPLLREPLKALAKSKRASYGSRYAVKHFGANIRFWTFDKNAKTRDAQIKQCIKWGFTKLRTNEPYMYLDVYDIHHAVQVTEDCLAKGIEYTICPVAYNPTLDDFVTTEQFNAIYSKYNGRIFDTRAVICALGIGLNMQPIRDHLLGVVSWMRDLFPQGVRMQAFNGPELDGYQYWNLYDPDFRAWARSIGFPAEEGDGINELIHQNYESFKAQERAIWGEPFLDQGAHHYAWANSVAYVGVSPYVTEYGVNRYQVSDLKAAFETLPNRIINYTAQNGVQITIEGEYFNVLEMFLHSPIDPRFLDLWLVENGTKALWNPSLYRRLLKKSDSSRNTMNEFDGVMMDTRLASVVTRTSKRLRGV
jgi:hypothetical protein